MRHEAALARIRLVRLGLVPQGSLIRHAFLELLRKEDKDNDCPILQVVQCGCLVEREPKQSLKLVLGAIACRAPLEGALASLRRQVAGLALRAQLLGLSVGFPLQSAWGLPTYKQLVRPRKLDKNCCKNQKGKTVTVTQADQ